MSQDPQTFSHSDYFAARAVEERRMAMATKDAHVRDIHLEMAERYAELAKTGVPDPLNVIGEDQRTA